MAMHLNMTTFTSRANENKSQHSIREQDIVASQNTIKDGTGGYSFM